MIGNDNGTVCIPTGCKHEPLSHINYCWIAKILELLSGGEKVNATPEQLLYLAKWLRSEIEKEKSETTKTEYVFYGLDGRNPQEEPTFDDFIQEGDNITVNKGGSRFNRSQLERVIASQEEPVSEELEDELTNYFNKFKGLESSNWNWRIDSVNIHSGGLLDFARHFVEWQKQKMIDHSIHGQVSWYDGEEFLDYPDEEFFYVIKEQNIKVGDDVRLVIIKDTKGK